MKKGLPFHVLDNFVFLYLLYFSFALHNNDDSSVVDFTTA